MEPSVPDPPAPEASPAGRRRNASRGRLVDRRLRPPSGAGRGRPALLSRGTRVTPTPPLLAETRMTLVVGLRGLAALAVLGFHFCMRARLPHEHASWMPDPLEWVLEHGYLGVQLFFVLSGFVIAYSVRGRRVSA